jgi:IS1 transposase/MaoC like domain
MTERYREDCAVGPTFRSRRLRIDAEQIKSFAAAFDPPPFHLDEAAARDTIFRGLAASGWHTAAVTMRLLVESDLTPAGGIVGAVFEECRWPRPVRPGDELRVETDYWGAYTRHLDPDVHCPGKRNTQKIERKHLTLRTRIKRLVRKTICFSKTTQMHDIVIGLFVNRYAFGRAV